MWQSATIMEADFGVPFGKEATRRRIMKTAGRRFKRYGIDSSGISTPMADVGPTNGAFCTHFASKDDLVTTASPTSCAPRARTALCGEIGRWTDVTKEAYTDGVLRLVDGIDACRAQNDPQSARLRALGLFAMMAGTLQTSRACPTGISRRNSLSRAYRRRFHRPASPDRWFRVVGVRRVPAGR